MSKTAFEEIQAGLEEAIRHAEGQPGKTTTHHVEPMDVRAIREKTGLSQKRFAETFGIPLGTLRHWEQGLRYPHGPARALLKVIAWDPVAVVKALQENDPADR